MLLHEFLIVSRTFNNHVRCYRVICDPIVAQVTKMSLKISAGCYGDSFLWYKNTGNNLTYGGATFYGSNINLLDVLKDAIFTRNESIDVVTDFADLVAVTNDSNYMKLLPEIRSLHEGFTQMDLYDYVIQSARLPYARNFIPYKVSAMNLQRCEWYENGIFHAIYFLLDPQRQNFKLQEFHSDGKHPSRDL